MLLHVSYRAVFSLVVHYEIQFLRSIIGYQRKLVIKWLAVLLRGHRVSVQYEDKILVDEDDVVLV